MDRVNKHLTVYAKPRKRGRKWYKKIFYYLLDLSAWNGFILYQKSSGERNSFYFWLELIHQIMENSHYGQMKSKGGRPSNTMHPKRLFWVHSCKWGEDEPNTPMCSVQTSTRSQKQEGLVGISVLLPWLWCRYLCGASASTILLQNFRKNDFEAKILWLCFVSVNCLVK